MEATEPCTKFEAHRNDHFLICRPMPHSHREREYII
jgi:hypothetical protein